MMTHGDPSAGHVPSRTGRQTPVLAGNNDQPTSGGEDSAGNNTPMSAKMGKMMSVRVLMLDDSITVFQIQVRKFYKWGDAMGEKVGTGDCNTMVGTLA